MSGGPLFGDAGGLEVRADVDNMDTERGIGPRWDGNPGCQIYLDTG